MLRIALLLTAELSLAFAPPLLVRSPDIIHVDEQGFSWAALGLANLDFQWPEQPFVQADTEIDVAEKPVLFPKVEQPDSITQVISTPIASTSIAATKTNRAQRLLDELVSSAGIRPGLLDEIAQAVDYHDKDQVINLYVHYPELVEVIARKGWFQDAKELIWLDLENRVLNGDTHLPHYLTAAVANLNDPVAGSSLADLFILSPAREFLYDRLRYRINHRGPAIAERVYASAATEPESSQPFAYWFVASTGNSAGLQALYWLQQNSQNHDVKIMAKRHLRRLLIEPLIDFDIHVIMNDRFEQLEYVENQLAWQFPNTNV